MTHRAPHPRAVLETPVGGLPFLRHPDWATRFPWLLQGTTTGGDQDVPFDLGLFSDASPAGDVMQRWKRLGAFSGFRRIMHAHQVHGAVVRLHRQGAPGLHVSEDCDGHATADRGVLLAVTVADCVPVFMVQERLRAVAMVHAGWRGAAAGILEAGLTLFEERLGGQVHDVHVHLGPSICGACYEVGPEVFRGLGLEEPEGPYPLDLKSALATRAWSAGVPRDQVTASKHCTLCGDAGLFSHRGGNRERQVGVLGLRP